MKIKSIVRIIAWGISLVALMYLFIVVYAIISGYVHGYRLNRKTADLGIAASQGDTNAVKTLLARGVDPNTVVLPDGTTALMEASDAGYVGIVKLLLNRGANVNAKDSHGWTALILAAWDGRTEVVKALLAGGADLSTKDMFSETAIQHAADEGHEQIVRLLRQATEKKTRQIHHNERTED